MSPADPTDPDQPSIVALDDGKPTAARVYDVMLDGKDNYAVDRQVAEASLSVMPELKEIALHNRAVLRRVVHHLAAEQGITQFLDLGSGLPTVGNTHEVAQAANPDAKVVYVDIDPIVLAHGRALLEDNPNTKVVTADIRKPLDMLEHPEVTSLIDFDKPVCVMLVGILHHILDEEDPEGIVATLRNAVPSGSYFFITNFTRLSDTPESEELERVLLSQLGTGRVRTPAELARYFEGLDPLSPGIVPLPLWRPEEIITDATTVGVRFMTGGVARKP
ncbi:SAM-dependent methyltransferase [Saccharomonospora azurea]|uniref:SAM-dependent methyltransferase n=1 Tax=Saccharomonospora azurea TaxID=40988 RepID=UPI00332C3EFE